MAYRTFFLQRPDWFASVRMYSTRTHNMEEPYNSEGLLNHHRGDGANHISRTGDEYLDIWPVYDYQKIPGATIMQKPELPSHEEIQQLGLTDFVGAATNGQYGTVAFDFRSPHDPLIARKSWFFLMMRICLSGSRDFLQQQGITCIYDDQSMPFQRAGSDRFKEKKLFLKKARTIYETAEWVYHDGMGYVFQNPTTVNIKNNSANGSWWRINKQTDSPKDEMNLDVFSLWIDHGKRPSDEAYAYIVVPATSVKKLEQEESKNNISILANTLKFRRFTYWVEYVSNSFLSGRRNSAC
ncbi:MAG: polysaccharide lyase family 8 super-sandwich domain-containing protein [Bacteroidia bacterium]